MKADTLLDCALFQLSPKRTRCELFASAGDETEKLASGFLKPFLTHLEAAEEQIARGAGHLIKLEASDRDRVAPWFTKGTLERFVRFVSTPEVLERVYTIDAEMLQLDQAKNFQLAPYSHGCGDQLVAFDSAKDVSRAGLLSKSRSEAEPADVSKRELLRAIDVRLMALQQELSMAFVRAATAGFAIEHMADLMVFAEQFGATRLRDACAKFMALGQKRQEVCPWLVEPSTSSPSSCMSIENGLCDFPPASLSKQAEIADVRGEDGDMVGKHEDSGLVSSVITSQISLDLHSPLFARAAQTGASGFTMSASDVKQAGKVLKKNQAFHSMAVGSQQDKDGVKPSDFCAGYSCHRQESVFSSSAGASNNKTNLINSMQKSPVTNNFIRQFDPFSGFDNLGTEASSEPINIASVEFEQPTSDKDDQSQADTNRHPVGSPPRRRSSSPMQRVSIGREASWQSNPAVVRSTNYYQDLPNRYMGSNTESRSSDDAKSDCRDNDESELAQKPEPTRRLSVQDAIHLFERKQNEGKGSESEGIRRFGKLESRRLSSDSGNSHTTEKPVLRRWSGASDMNIEAAVQQAMNGSQNQNENASVPWSGNKSDVEISLSDSRVQSSINGDHHWNPVEVSSKSKFSLVGNDKHHKGVEERKEASSASPSPNPEELLAYQTDKTVGLSHILLPNEQTSNVDEEPKPLAMQGNNLQGIRKESTNRSFQEFQTAALPLKQSSETAYGFYHTRSRSSGCEPITISVKAKQPKSNHELNEELAQKGNQLELFFAAHKPTSQAQRPCTRKKMSMAPNETSLETEHEVMFTTPVQNIGRESLGSAWSNGVDFDIQVLMDMVDRNHINWQHHKELTGFAGDGSSAELRGKFYEHYKEKRDAKLRDEQTTKRAEKETKLKAMQEVLERRKAEMATRSMIKQDPVVQDKKITFSCSVDMPKDLTKANGPRKLPAIASRNFSSLASSPRSSLPVVSSSSNISFSGRRRNQADNPLARSVPNFTDLRKENTKPSPGRSTFNSSIHEKGAKSCIELKNNSKSSRCRETSPLDSNGRGSGAASQSANSKEEKKSRSQATQRKSVCAPVMHEISAKGSKASVSEPSFYSKVTKRSSVAPLEIKPFLRKGRGIGPGAGPVIAKMKQSLPVDDALKNTEDEGQGDDQNEEDIVEGLGNLLQSSNSLEETAAAEKNDIGKEASDEAEMSDNQGDSDISQNDMQGDDAKANVSPFAMLSSPTASENEHNEKIGKMDSAAEISITAASSSGCMASHPREHTASSFSSVSGSPSLHMATVSDHFSPSVTMESPLGSPTSWTSHMHHSVSQMLETSNIDATRTRKKWGSTQKLVLATTIQQQHQKDAPKGLKRLLNFGRKSRGSESVTTDWISASTTSEGDDDMEEPRDLASRSADDLLRKARMQAKSFLPGQSAFDVGSTTGIVEIESFLEQCTIEPLRSSIPAPPVNFKLREDHLSGGTLLKAPRSFFSLSSFRSKGSDSKLR